MQANWKDNAFFQAAVKRCSNLTEELQFSIVFLAAQSLKPLLNLCLPDILQWHF